MQLYCMRNVVSGKQAWSIDGGRAFEELHFMEAHWPYKREADEQLGFGRRPLAHKLGGCDPPAACAGRTRTSNGVAQKESQDVLWQRFFQDPAEWWDNRLEKRSSRHPDFRHKTYDQALWLNSYGKPGWVDSELARWDAEKESASAGNGGSRILVDGGFRNGCEDGELREAVEGLEFMVKEGRSVGRGLLYRVLKKCMAQKDLGLGRRVHALSRRAGYEGDLFLANHIIGMYAGLGKLEKALQVFGDVTAPDVYVWGTIILAHARQGKSREAIKLYRQMRESGVKADNHVFVAVLKACAAAGDLVSGKEVHGDILESAVAADIFVDSSLVTMYAKCRSLEDARKVFDALPTRSVVTWNAMIAGYAQNGLGQQALDLYEIMQQDGLTPADHVTFVCLLKACASVAALRHGKQLHALICERGLEADVSVGSSLLDMYAKCKSLEDARTVFDSLPSRNVVTWNAMMAGYTQHGLGEEALALYASMPQDGMSIADDVTFACLLKACASVGALHYGKELHEQMKERGLEADVLVGNCLVDMYAKCGSLEDARRVFDTLQAKDVVSWTVMIAGYSHGGKGHEALALYENMQKEAIAPADHVTFVCLLQACANIKALSQGKQLHQQIRERFLEADLAVGSSLVDMYAKCGSLEDARRVFDLLPTRNAVTCTAMIAGYTQQGLGSEALALAASLQQEGVMLDSHVTFVCLLQACASIGALEQGKQVHAQIQQRGLQADVVIGNCLLDMYLKCGSVEDAQSVFDSLTTKDVVTWTTMIAGYTQQGLGRQALALYASMQREAMTPADRVTYVCLLQTCASMGALQQGKQLYAQIRASGLEADASVGSSLVDMYAKCGSLAEAREVFDRLATRDVVTWNALLNGYAEHGDGEKAVQFFTEMRQQGVKPDGATFICLLVACSHAGLVHKGQQFFRMMVEDFGILPTECHYNCMVDLLGRSGHLDEAEDLLQTSCSESDAVGWTSLLSACRSHADMERGRRCFDRLVQLEPNTASSYVLLANIYAEAGRWDEVGRIENMRKVASAVKKPAMACIEVKSEVHEFRVGEERADISSKLKSVNLRLKDEGGHVPQTGLVLKAVSEQEKEDALCGHAEKLALAYGLLNTPDGTTLIVTKNLRMCNDCHSSTKIMSHLEKREIVVRDAHRVHRFSDGTCSCADRH